MNCEWFDNLIIDYIYGELAPDEAASVEEHMRNCPSCAEKVKELSSAREMASGLPDPEPSKMVIGRITAQARDEAAKGQKIWGFGWLKIFAALCLMAVVGGLVSQQMRSGLLVDEGIKTPSEKEYAVSARPEPVTVKEEPKSPGASPPPVTEKKKADPVETAMTESASAGLRGDCAMPDVKPVMEKAPSDVSTAPDTRPTMEPAPAPQHKPKMRSATRAPMRKAMPTANGRLDEPEKPAASEGGMRSDELKTSRRLTRGMFLDSELEEHETSTPDRLAKGKRAVESGEYIEAAHVLHSLLKTMPAGHKDRPIVLLWLARAYEGRGHFVKAREIYMVLVEESPAHREMAIDKIRELDEIR